MDLNLLFLRLSIVWTAILFAGFVYIIVAK
jgi:hypothetical protein